MGPLDIISVGSLLIDKLISSPAEKEKAKADLLSLYQNGELERLKVQLSAIVQDSQSADPWTSRARPSFLYVVYALLLWSIPMGALTVLAPDNAKDFVAGFRAWLEAIPEPILTLFGVVMTGYVAGRSWEKVKGAAK